jgi:hypothetical protein
MDIFSRAIFSSFKRICSRPLQNIMQLSPEGVIVKNADHVWRGRYDVFTITRHDLPWMKIPAAGNNRAGKLFKKKIIRV